MAITHKQNILAKLRSSTPLPLPIVGVDPGKTIGLARLRPTPPSVPPQGEFMVFWELQQLTWPGDLDLLNGFLIGAKLLVVEGFRLFPHKSKPLIGSSFTPVEVIGHLKAWSITHGVPLVEQPAAIKQACTNKYMEQFTNQSLRLGHHSRDAMRHIIFYLVKEAKANAT